MHRDLFRFEILINGKSIREYAHKGEVWVEGRKGSAFSLRVANSCYCRVLAVPSIDGLSVMNGEEASLNSNGYIIEGGMHVDIPGWRLDNDNVAQFRFHKPHNSYAAKSGSPMNIGIIGCAVFAEVAANRPSIVLNSLSRSRSCSFDSDPCSPQSGEAVYSSNHMDWMPVEPDVRRTSSPSLGTEFGRQMGHKVTEVPFEKEPNPSAVFEIRYGTREELKERGINLEQRPGVGKKPSAFPKEPKGCVPPEGWPNR